MSISSIFGLGRCHHANHSEPHVSKQQISQFASNFKEIKNLSGSGPFIFESRSGKIQILQDGLAKAIGTINSDTAHHKSNKIKDLEKINNSLIRYCAKINYKEKPSQPKASGISASNQLKMEQARSDAIKNGENNGAYR